MNRSYSTQVSPGIYHAYELHYSCLPGIDHEQESFYSSSPGVDYE